jgi:hypothetical protein
MRPKAGRHGHPLFPVLLIGVLTSACSGTSAGSEAAATPDPAEASGPGAYAVPADLRRLCDLLSYEALIPVLGPPKGTAKAELAGADLATSSTVTCTQSLGPRPDGDANSGGLATTRITFWRDVDKAKVQFQTSKESDVRNYARDNHVDDQPGVGAEAYRYVGSGVTDTVLMLRTATRYSNLEVAVDFIALASAGGSEVRSKEVLDAAAPYLTSLLSTVRAAAPRSSPSA